MRTLIGTILAMAFVAAADESLMLMRLRGPHTADDAQWAKTFKALAANRAACDEVWFSLRWTGTVHTPRVSRVTRNSFGALASCRASSSRPRWATATT